MFRLFLALIVLACPAAAECFGPPLPTGAVRSNYTHLGVVRRTTTDVTFREPLKTGASLIRIRHGFFMISRTEHSQTTTWQWPSDLPAPESWFPGMTGHFEAEITYPADETGIFMTDITMLRRDEINLAGCAYPVIVVEVQNTEGNDAKPLQTVWFAPNLRMALRTEELVGSALPKALGTTKRIVDIAALE